MNYSFTQPIKKTLFTKLSRIWLGYIFLTFFIFAGFLTILKVQGYFMQEHTKVSIKRQRELLDEIKNLQEALVTEKENVQFENAITYQNILLKESVENLFALIPDQITLNKIQMERYQLTLYGTTPSKQVYAFLLEVPLRSIFNHSRADFYMLPNGWYNFISVSKLDPPQE